MLRRLILSFAALLFAAVSACAAPRSIHVVVALCDNVHQGIVPVSAALGDGQSPAKNLYWGAAFGVKTFFNKQKDWRLLAAETNGNGPILERLIYKHAEKDVYLVAEAYDGRFIRKTTEDFLAYAAGRNKRRLDIQGTALAIGGDADLVVYVGHNGLMDFRLPDSPAAAPDQRPGRQAAVLACMSRQYFSAPLARAGISPALLTTQLMAPEAYVLHALADGWIREQPPQRLRAQVAETYSRYQKLARPALRLFSTDLAGN